MSEKSNHFKVIVIGSGPAGFTAALYTARANLNPAIFEGMQPGGQLTITTEIENYPGFENGIQGPELMDIMRKQVLRFGATSFYQEVIGKEEDSKKTMTGVLLEDTKDHSTQVFEAQGLFIAIGHKPNTDLFKGMLDMDETGYLKLKSGSTYTKIEGVFAAGDVADKAYRQAITAAGLGCMAAIDAERWLETQAHLHA